jgi:hypothetical protein
MNTHVFRFSIFEYYFKNTRASDENTHNTKLNTVMGKTIV